MNILHHKSWHVYNKTNIERVRKDEAEAEAEAKKKQERALLAESEARLNLLRKRAEARLLDEGDTSIIQHQKVEHVNLFKDLADKSNNEEHEDEKNEKDKKWERQITMYLDKGTTKDGEPWYTKKDRKDEKYVDPYTFKSNKKQKREPVKLNDDPLHYISKTLKKREEKKRRKEYKSRHEHKSRHERDRKRKEVKKEAEKKSGSLTIEELRARRLERERNEKARLQSIYMGHDSNEQDEVELDDRKRTYNSQFNREETLKAKQNINNKRLRRGDLS
ncbi:MAG: hypothetical protein EXX96DRAFT_654009 [Benjaminiella poitrasii]|nr:MAG: hypothetical protein EXX96DRAFT_654009 [Benjaminiella poitrasii]